MPEVVNSLSFVLFARDFGESDKIVTLFSRSRGKQRAIAKGAKRSVKRFLNALEPCNLLETSLVLSTRQGGLDRIDSCCIKETFPGIRSCYNRFLSATLACELLDLWLKDLDPHPGLFGLLNWHLTEMNRREQPGRMAIIFAVRTLSLVGYGGQLGRCIKCNSELHGRGIQLKPEQGGFLCGSCWSGEPVGKNIFAAGAARSLAFFQDAPYESLSRLRLSPDLMLQCWNIVSVLHSVFLQRTPKSFQMVSRVRESFFSSAGSEVKGAGYGNSRASNSN